MPSVSFIQVFTVSVGGLDSYYAVSPKEIKAKIIFATKITGRKLFQIITEINTQTLKSGYF